MRAPSMVLPNAIIDKGFACGSFQIPKFSGSWWWLRGQRAHVAKMWNMVVILVRDRNRILVVNDPLVNHGPRWHMW